MTGTELSALILKKTRTTITTFPVADQLVYVNIFMKEIASEIAKVRTESFNVELNDDLSDDVRGYDFKAVTMDNLIRLELKFSSSGDYVLATFVKQSRIRIALQESVIVNYFNNQYPSVFIRGKQIFILSGTIVDVTDGIKWVLKSFPTPLVNLTGNTDLSAYASATLPGFPIEFHELLARRVVIEYKDINELKLSSKERKYEIDLALAINRFKEPSLDVESIGVLPPASEVGDDGFDY